jgi:hypothetical protein
MDNRVSNLTFNNHAKFAEATIDFLGQVKSV